MAAPQSSGKHGRDILIERKTVVEATARVSTLGISALKPLLVLPKVADAEQKIEQSNLLPSSSTTEWL